MIPEFETVCRAAMRVSQDMGKIKMGRIVDTPRVASFAAAFGLCLGASAANAADLLEPPVIAPIAHEANWYLRGHIGMSNQGLAGLEHAAFEGPAFYEWLNEGHFDSAPIFGVGIGVIRHEFLRFDVIGEYRGNASFSAMDRYDSDDNPPDFDGDTDEFANGWGINDYTAKKSEFLLMANAYADLGHGWHGIKPYVGGGVGASYNVISGFNDNNIITGGGGYADTGGMWNLAWALHAGLSFRASENVVLDLGYSFLNLGDAKTATFVNYDSDNCGSCTPVKFKDIISHDLKLTVRYEFGGGHYGGGYSSYPEPVIAKY